MAKLWLFLVVAIVVVLFVRVASVRKRLGADRGRSEHVSARKSEEMVPCAHCSLNVPVSEALGTGPRYFCSEEHMRRNAA